MNLSKNNQYDNRSETVKMGQLCTYRRHHQGVCRHKESPTLGCNVGRQFLRIKGTEHFFGVVLCTDHEYHKEKILKNKGMCLVYPL